jgi:hypothetical protein
MAKPKKASKPRAKKVVSDLQAARREIKMARKAGACRDVRAGAALMIEAARAAAKNPDMKPAQRHRIQREAVRASKSARGFCTTLSKKVDKAKAALAKLEHNAALKGFQGRR